MRIKSFRNEKKKKYYFRVYNEQEDQILKSEAYNSKEARNNGIESFKANASISERYERKTAADGKFYFNIKAANHQVVATSLMFDIESEREATIEAIIAYATKSSSASAQKLAATPKTTDATVTSDTSKEDDDYMDVEFYETSGTDTTSGFDRFQKGDNNYHYFSFKSDDGKVLLLSQGYTQESGRDNGIASVEKNAIIESRYATHTTDDGKFFFTLKAGNHQEIAKSVVFDTEEAMQKAMAILMNGGGAMVETVAKAAPLAASGKEDDDYMEVEFYETLGTDTTSGFDRFQKGDNNYHYFSFKSDDGKVLLLSQGYTQESGRDNGIASVEKNATIESRYATHTTDDGKFFFTLKAGNHQEIAKSVIFDTEEAMQKAMIILMNGGGAMVETVAKAAPLAASGKEDDDYMEVEFYETSGTDTTSGFDRFQKGDNNYHYFSFKSDDGKVLLLSQGYTQESGRNNGIASVEKNATIESRYATHKTDDG
ncbi:MAG: YegP family protein, partial [Bacteroidota bacterium]